MTRFLFVSLPLAGHLDWGGMLATAAVLSRRPEHQVAWASGPEVAAAVGRAGIEFFELPNTGWSDLPFLPAGFSAEQLAVLRQQRGLDSWLDPAAILPAAADLQALFADWRPDAIVLEPYAAAAALAAEASATANRRLRPARAARPRPAHRADASQPTHSLFMCTVRGDRALLGP